MRFADVRLWHKADMLNALTNVRFWGQSGHTPTAATKRLPGVFAAAGVRLLQGMRENDS
jgi:hypothetical protein